MNMKKILFFVFLFCVLFQTPARSATMVDIYGPGQNIVNLSMAKPLTAPMTEAKALGAVLDNKIRYNLSFLPFMNLVPDVNILGGTLLDAWSGANLDFRRFQIGGADLLITAYWANGDKNGSKVELRVFETFSGKFIFGNAYNNITDKEVEAVADKFCADLMKALTGSGDFFLSTLTFAKDENKNKRDIWIVSPTGKNLRQITSLKGIAMSPAWSPDGRYIVFSHIDDGSHALGVWQSANGRVQRIRFPGNTVIGPSFMPDNKVAVSLSSGSQPNIYLLDHRFRRERVLEDSASIDVSPTFDHSGTKMVFTSNRLGGPQIFLKDFSTGTATRVSKTGTYNTEPAISPDGTVVAYTKGTAQGHRIFVHDLVTGIERQVSFGPGRDEQPSFAPDSYFLSFVSNRTGVKQIYLITRHGGTAKHVPTGNGNAYFPRWGKIPQ